MRQSSTGHIDSPFLPRLTRRKLCTTSTSCHSSAYISPRRIPVCSAMSSSSSRCGHFASTAFRSLHSSSAVKNREHGPEAAHRHDCPGAARGADAVGGTIGRGSRENSFYENHRHRAPDCRCPFSPNAASIPGSACDLRAVCQAARSGGHSKGGPECSGLARSGADRRCRGANSCRSSRCSLRKGAHREAAAVHSDSRWRVLGGLWLTARWISWRDSGDCYSGIEW